MNNCTILRTMQISRYKLSMATGETVLVSTEVVTRACDVPLFSDHERKVGVCRSCAGGWAAPGNVFANDAERVRALAVAEVQS